MNINEIKRKMLTNKEFRQEYAEALVRRAFPVQIRKIRKKRRMSQAELAEKAKIEQGVVSRAENPNYGKLTFNTALRVAAGFENLFFVPRLVGLDEFLKWVAEVSEGFPASSVESAGEQIEPGAPRSEARATLPSRLAAQESALSGQNIILETQQKPAAIPREVLAGRMAERREYEAFRSLAS